MQHLTTWVATFNGAEARFYLWDRPAHHVTLIDLGLAPGAHRAEFTDRPVRSYSSASTARGAGDPRMDSERALENSFVGQVVSALADQLEKKAFQHLVIAAPARALGAFRATAPDMLMKSVRIEIPHDYVNTPVDALLARLSEHVVP